MNKYIKGRDLTLLELIEELRKRRYVFLCDKPKHPAVIENMTFLTICVNVRHRRFYKAIETNPKQRG